MTWVFEDSAPTRFEVNSHACFFMVIVNLCVCLLSKICKYFNEVILRPYSYPTCYITDQEASQNRHLKASIEAERA